MTWHLENVLDRKKDAPYTFYIPSSFVLDKIKPGDNVKLIFNIENPPEEGPTSERMWVLVTKRNGNFFKGTLDNQPMYIEGLEYEDEISFETIHISNTEYTDPEADEQEKYMDVLAVASNDVLEIDSYNVMVRDEPHAPEDCGWIFYSGREDEEYIQNADNLTIVSLGVLLNMDDSCLSFMDTAPIGCVYERQEDGQLVLTYEE